MQFDQYLTSRLLNADRTSYANDLGVQEYLCVEDGNSRLSRSHTMPHCGMTFNNIGHEGQMMEEAMAEFYKNSLHAQDPLIPDVVLCNPDRLIPEYCKLRVLHWPYKGYFLFSSKTGFLSDKWWHTYGWLPNL